MTESIQTIEQLKAAYSQGLSVEKVISEHLENIEESEKNIHALLHISKEKALEKAKELDNKGFDASKPLFGVPMTIKDAICTKNIPTTAASKILEGFVPPYSATVVEKLEKAGAIILGKNNLDEFAMGSSCENSGYFPTKNPHDFAKVPGGSSGGSAASVASKQCFASLGTDTGGSIRQPANLCGCYGIKPTYGRVSRYGVIAYASSLDQVGPFARSTEDLAQVLQVIAGHDVLDTTSSPNEVPDYTSFLNGRQSLNGVTLGIPKEFMQTEKLDEEVLEACQNCISHAKDLGAEIVEVSLPNVQYSLATYYIIATAEAGSNLARYDGIRFGKRAQDISNLDELYIKSRTEGFGQEVQRRMLLGAFVLSSGYYDAYYKKAAQIRRLIRDDYVNALKQCDAILSPVSPIPAWDLNAVHDPIQMYLMDIFTLSLNLAGLPGIAFPFGQTKSGLPLGMQLLGKAFDEGNLLAYSKVLTEK